MTARNSPRVTAEASYEGVAVEFGNGTRMATADVSVSVTFSYGSGEEALASLDLAVAEVKSQIEQTLRSDG